MAIPYWTVTLDPDGAATPITNVQAVTVNNGRRVLTDNYATGRATINGRRPDLLPTINIGDFVLIKLFNPNNSSIYFYGTILRVSDLQITYGTIPAMDEWTLYLEDVFASLGRSRIDYTWTAGTTTTQAVEDVCNEVGINVGVVSNATPKTISATTVTDANALNVVQTLVNTEQGLLYATAELKFYTRNWQSDTAFYAFGDAGGSATTYQQVQFLSMADNYATYVLVTINGGTPTVTGTGVYSYALDTYALDATEAGYVGQYVEGALSAADAVPNTLSVLLNTETSQRTLDALQPNSGVTLTLRSSTYTANIIGWTVSTTPELTRVTFNLAGTDQYNYLVLDSATYGTLDYNRLGF